MQHIAELFRIGTMRCEITSVTLAQCADKGIAMRAADFPLSLIYFVDVSHLSLPGGADSIRHRSPTSAKGFWAASCGVLHRLVFHFGVELSA